ncbi:uncharacterized protein LAESUDRAFT_725525 [Laetiporus sulphureus 93-53]|uniref:Endoplasmic reticulum protein n=1 Tax=Laetiporus sulphureus 93-53 TaxID=1314785 RepID=A0A165ED05_9APHY|nr:uncharacterized protein LAESUDRAFT_725525 [Laetiporus sulphureus 93-53]KZT06764.1 hypothetical protein LAESUDRAFT_725525 [Laetiporus sulphureus 93-53]
MLLVSSLRYFLAKVLFRGVSAWWYKTSFTGALLSYAIVCQKSLGTPQPTLAYINRAMIDENVQYLLLAFFWWTSKPITLALVPYTIFSLFHALTFTRTTLMPRIFPQGPPATAGGTPTPHPAQKRLQMWVKANYDTAMRIVAYTELVIMLRVFLGALTFRNSLIAPIIFAHFLRARYHQSKFTQASIGQINSYVEAYVRKPTTNSMIVYAWDQFKAVLFRWVGSTFVPPNAAGAGARRQ